MIVSHKMLPFLAENRKKNSRVWYLDHKEEYKKLVYLPFSEIVKGLAPDVLRIDSLIVTEPRYAISRLNRDTRFSKDKSTLYRDNVWITFKRPSARWSSAPAFYLEVMQTGWRYGMGYYCCGAQTMSLFRKYISEHPEDFRKIIRPLKSLYLDTEKYKRRPAGDCPDDLADWFMAKSVHVTYWEPDTEKLYNDSFLDDVRSGFLQAAPLYKFLMELETLPRQEEDGYIPENRVEFEW